MKLIVGLGNPGASYADTYHNVGFIALDVVAERLSAPSFKKKDCALVCDAVNPLGEKILLVKPETYMNLSGDAVCRFARYYKIPPKDILVVYDDIDIKKGIVRARNGGSAGTHNGMRDIVAKLGSVDFCRVRIGTGLKPDYMNLADYVLSHIPAAEKPVIKKACEAAADFAESFALCREWGELTVDVLK